MAGAGSALDQTDFAGPGALRRFFGSELDPLTLTEQLEHGAPDGAAVEEMLGPALIAVLIVAWPSLRRPKSPP